MLTRRPNLLVLDEPGNHLDFAGLAWLEKFLQEWDGAVLVVSHDRCFLDKIAASIVQIEDCAFQAYHGSFNEFRARREGRAAGSVPKRVAELERRITEYEAEKQQVETDITVAFSKGNSQEGRRLANRLAQVSRMLQELYEEWESMAGKRCRAAMRGRPALRPGKIVQGDCFFTAHAYHISQLKCVPYFRGDE